MRNMSELWEMWAYLPPHQLEDTEHLPKFKGLRHQAGYNLPRELHRLDDLLDENDDLDPVLSLRNKPHTDFNPIWDVGTETASADDIIMAAMEATAHDQIAAVTSDLAQAAAGTLPLMVCRKQLYLQAGTVWTPLDKADFILAYQQDPRIRNALHSFSGHGLNDLYKKVLIQPSIQRDIKDVQMPPSLIPCRDGVFDLETMRPRNVRPDDYFFSCCDVPVDEIGEGSGKHFENFLAFVGEGNPVIRQQILEMIGVIISGYMPKKFFLLLGPRDTGKSQIMNLLRNLIGDQCTQSISDPNELSGPWMSGSLIGKRLCYCPDAARVTFSQKSAAALKQLTGDDLIQANIKYKQPLTFRNEAKIVFVSNYPLMIPRDEAVESRILTIPFSVSIPKERQIPHFSELLYRERGYIVGAAIEALKDLADRHFQFTRADSVTQVPTCAFGGSIMEQIARFVEERCQLDPDGKEYSDTLYQAFCAFSEGNGGSSVSREVFSRTLNSIVEGLESLHTSRQRGYRGIRLRDNFPAN